MPRTGVEQSNLLSIELNNAKSSWLPGDTIRGNVKRRACFEQPQPQVKITLFARCKTKIKRDNFTSSSIYRGRQPLLEITQHLEFLEDSSPSKFHKAPFTFVIPSKTLPTVFYYKEKGVCTETEAYIEYALIAETVGNPNGVARASLPLFIRSPSTLRPIRDFKTEIKETRKVVKTHRLLAESGNRELTFGDRSQRLFLPFSIPRLGYTVHVEHPTVIQIDHPETIRFKVHIVPKVGSSSSNICSDGDVSRIPSMICTKVLLSLRCKTHIQAPATLVPQVSTWDHAYPLCRIKCRPDAQVPINAPTQQSQKAVQPHVKQIERDPGDGSPSPEMVTEEISKWLPKWASKRTQTTPPKNDSEIVHPPDTVSNLKTPTISGPRALDLGDRLKLQLFHFGVVASTPNPVRCFEKPLPQFTPSFSTDEITVSYTLWWNVTLEIADKSQVINGNAPVTVLAASEEQEKLRKRQIGTEGTGANDDDVKCVTKNLMAAGGFILCSVM